MSKVVAIDLDGCIVDYSRGWKGENVFGAIIPGCREALKRMKAEGHKIIIHTCRSVTKELIQYLDDSEIPYDSINEDVLYTHPQNNRKVHADVYIDDRAINFNGNWEKIPERVRGFMEWYKKEKYEEIC